MSPASSIQSPSGVACKPFGVGPGDLKIVSTGPLLRVGRDANDAAAAAVAGTPARGAAARMYPKSLRLMNNTFQPQFELQRISLIVTTATYMAGAIDSSAGIRALTPTWKSNRRPHRYTIPCRSYRCRAHIDSLLGTQYCQIAVEQSNALADCIMIRDNMWPGLDESAV